MPTPKLSLSALFRQRRHHHYSLGTLYHHPSISSLSSSPLSPIEPHQFASPAHRYLTTHFLFRHGGGGSCGGVHWTIGLLTRYNSLLSASSCYRSYSTNDDSRFDGPKSEGGEELLPDPGFFDYNDGGGGGDGAIPDVGITAGDVIGGGVGEEAVFPVRCLISFLDGVHDLTGLPWWIVIVISTLTLRVAILPVLLTQFSKLKRHAELQSQLPPPFPPPLSGKSWTEQYKRFRDKRKAIGCPSLLWIFAYPSVQLPCFILGTTSIRCMALDHYSGFDCGGILWFQNLTEFPHGASGFIFPLLIAGLHLVNVLVSLQQSSLKSMSGPIGLLAKYYGIYLQSLSIPILVGSFYLPQGSLVYWAANSSITLIQQLVLKHPDIREKFGLPDKLALPDSGNSEEVDGATLKVPSVGKTIHDLSPLELFNLSIKHLSKGEQNKAASLLRLALDKDPEYVRALIVMGQLLMKDGKLVEAIKCLERVITKLLLKGHPTEVEEIDTLILACTWAGVAYCKQGKVAEGIVHLERIANMKEPEDIRCKAHYCHGLFMLSSALASVGRDSEAAKYLRILMTYDPAYGEYLKQVEGGDDNFADDLVNSRRKDY